MPKKWKTNWPLTAGVTDEQRNDFVACIGNMTILNKKLNTSIRNAAWQTKLNGNARGYGLKEYASGLETFKGFETIPQWDEQSIKDRAEWLASTINNEWVSYIEDVEESETTDSTQPNLFGIEGQNRRGDQTKYSLNGGEYLSKSSFVFKLVADYLESAPSTTFAELSSIFKDGFRFKGFLLKESDYNAWDNKHKEKRYFAHKPERRLVSGDGIAFFVNTQWTQESMADMVKLAKHLGFKVKSKK